MYITQIKEIISQIPFKHLLEVNLYFILFILALRAIYFLSIKKDPINAIKPKMHWFNKRIKSDEVRKTFEDRG